MVYSRLWLVTLAKSTVDHVITYIQLYSPLLVEKRKKHQKRKSNKEQK